MHNQKTKKWPSEENQDFGGRKTEQDDADPFANLYNKMIFTILSNLVKKYYGTLQFCYVSSFRVKYTPPVQYPTLSKKANRNGEFSIASLSYAYLGAITL